MVEIIIPKFLSALEMLESTCKLCEKVEHERIDNFLYDNLVKHMESEREKEKLQQMKTIS